MVLDCQSEESASTLDTPHMNIPFRRILFTITIAKAAIAGASLGLAALGVTDLAFMATYADWWNEVRPQYLINGFAIAGSVTGVLFRVANIIS